MDNPEVIEGIQSRSRLLAYQYHQDYEDLFQDGMVHLLSYTQKKPDASFNQIMKSINYKYRDMSRKLRTRKRRNVSLETLPESFSSYETEDQILERISKEELEESLKRRGDEDGYSILILAGEFDLSLKDTEEMLGLKKGEVYRKIKNMI